MFCDKIGKTQLLDAFDPFPWLLLCIILRRKCKIFCLPS